MPRGQPRKAVRPVKKTIHLPEDIVAQVELELFSEAEGKVPFNAWGKLLTELLIHWLNERKPNGTGTAG